MNLVLLFVVVTLACQFFCPTTVFVNKKIWPTVHYIDCRSKFENNVISYLKLD